MKTSIRTLLLAGALTLATVALAGCGPEEYKSDKTPDVTEQRTLGGQPVYQPPAGAPVPGAPPAPGSR